MPSVPKTDVPIGPGVISVASADTSRYARFSVDLMSLKRPPGTVLAWATGYSVAHNHNVGIQQALDLNLDWVWIIGDDHAFGPSLLLELLSDDVDIVAPVCLRRKNPFCPVIFSGRQADQNGGEMYRQYGWNLPENRNLFEVAACGNAGMLVKTKVFRKMPAPWFKVGQVNPEKTGEDLTFCKEAREHGFKIHVDPRCFLGHISNIVYWPYTYQGQWGFELELDATVRYRVPVKLTPDRQFASLPFEATTNKPTKINLGCGNFPMPGYTNIDLHAPADIVGDFIGMAFKDVEEVRMHHTLEHQRWSQIPDVLAHIKSWLTPGGKFIVEVPDISIISQHPENEHFDLMMFGIQSQHGEFHYSSFTPNRLRTALNKAGFEVESTRQFNSTFPGRQGLPCLEAIAYAPRSSSPAQEAPQDVTSSAASEKVPATP